MSKVLVTLLIVFSMLLFGYSQLSSFVYNPSQKIFLVEAGSSVHSIADQLAKQHLVRWPAALKAYLKYSGQDKYIHHGEYLFDNGLSLMDLVRALVTGQTKNYRWTLVEGSTLSQILNQLSQIKELEHKLDDSIQPLLDATQLTLAELEGRFLPETYFFVKGTSDLDLLKRAFFAQQQVLDQRWQRRSRHVKALSREEIIILASLVEKESGDDQERPVIAGVFVTRLKQNMRLQTDPTVIYGLKNQYTGRLTKADLKYDTPYNTYLHKGLPPTAIAMPSLASLKAALHPQTKAGFIYFVSRGDGTHHFSVTYDEHKEAIQRYLKPSRP